MSGLTMRETPMTYVSNLHEQFTGTLDQALRKCKGELVAAYPLEGTSLRSLHWMDDAETEQWMRQEEPWSRREIVETCVACVVFLGAAIWIWNYWSFL